MSNGLSFVVALDLEFNKPSRNIIQIGAVVGDLLSGNIDSGFSCLVNPNGPLSPRVAALTGIDQEVADAAPSVDDAYLQMASWLKPYESIRSLIPLVWEKNAGGILCDAIGLKPSDEEWCFASKVNNVKQFYALARTHPLVFGLLMKFGLETLLVGSLESSVTQFGLTFEGEPNNAMYRAANIFRLYRSLMKQPQPNDQPPPSDHSKPSGQPPKNA